MIGLRAHRSPSCTRGRSEDFNNNVQDSPKKLSDLKRDFLNPEPDFERACRRVALPEPSDEKDESLLFTVRTKILGSVHTATKFLLDLSNAQLAIEKARVKDLEPDFAALNDRLRTYRAKPAKDERENLLDFPHKYFDILNCACADFEALSKLQVDRYEKNEYKVLDGKNWRAIRKQLKIWVYLKSTSLEICEKVQVKYRWAGLLDNDGMRSISEGLVACGLDLLHREGSVQ